MKSIFKIACILLLFALTQKASSQALLKEKNNNYWVTETGPCTNLYTIRLGKP